MEEETKTKQADLPSNFVTLLQLQERWIKQQKRKQQKEQQKQQVEETNAVASTNQTANSEGVEMKKKKKKKKKKTKKKSEKEAEEEGKEKPEGQPEPDAKKVWCRRQRGNIPARRNVYVRKNDSKILRRKVGDVAEESDRSVEIEGGKCDDTVEIEQKLENVRVEEESDVSGKEKGGYVGKGNRTNGKFGYHNGGSDRPYRVYTGSYGRPWQFRGYDWGVRRGNGWNGRGYQRDDRNRMVWVKKEHDADDAVDVHDRGSSSRTWRFADWLVK